MCQQWNYAKSKHATFSGTLNLIWKKAPTAPVIVDGRATVDVETLRSIGPVTRAVPPGGMRANQHRNIFPTINKIMNFSRFFFIRQFLDHSSLHECLFYDCCTSVFVQLVSNFTKLWTNGKTNLHLPIIHKLLRSTTLTANTVIHKRTISFLKEGKNRSAMLVMKNTGKH